MWGVGRGAGGGGTFAPSGVTQPLVQSTAVSTEVRLARTSSTHSCRTDVSVAASAGTVALYTELPSSVTFFQPVTWTPPVTFVGSALLPTPRHTTRAFPAGVSSCVKRSAPSEPGSTPWLPGPRQTSRSCAAVESPRSAIKERTALCAAPMDSTTTVAVCAAASSSALLMLAVTYTSHADDGWRTGAAMYAAEATNSREGSMASDCR